MNRYVEKFFRSRTPLGSVVSGIVTFGICWVLDYQSIGALALLIWVATAAAQHLWIDPKLAEMDAHD